LAICDFQCSIPVCQHRVSPLCSLGKSEPLCGSPHANLPYLCTMDDKLRFKLLEEELRSYKKALSQAADTILDERVSNYPIFVAHKGEASLGIPIIKQEEVSGNWSINASSLEEFTAKKLIREDRLDDFKAVYKDPEEWLCLFVVDETGAHFIFLPRQDNASN